MLYNLKILIIITINLIQERYNLNNVILYHKIQQQLQLKIQI